MNYQTTLQSWHDFYSITGTAAASLVGLLFVGLSLHLRVVITHGDVQALARVTLTSFGLTLVLCLFMVIPETQPSATGWELVILGAVGCLLIARSFVVGVRTHDRTLSIQRLLMRFGLSALTFTGVIATGGLLVGGDYRDALGWLVSVAVFLVVISLRNSWDLLVTVAAATAPTTVKES